MAMQADYRDTEVVVMQFSRHPRSFREALFSSPLLGQYRAALEDAGYETELHPSKAKVFVPPDMYQATCEAVQQRLQPQGGLKAAHVIVPLDLEPTVMEAIRPLPRGEKVRLKMQSKVPVPLNVSPQTGAASSKDLDFVASTMCTGGDSDQELIPEDIVDNEDELIPDDIEEDTQGGVPYIVERTFIHVPMHPVAPAKTSHTWSNGD